MVTFKKWYNYRGHCEQKLLWTITAYNKKNENWCICANSYLILIHIMYSIMFVCVLSYVQCKYSVQTMCSQSVNRGSVCVCACVFCVLCVLCVFVCVCVCVLCLVVVDMRGERRAGFSGSFRISSRS